MKLHTIVHAPSLAALLALGLLGTLRAAEGPIAAVQEALKQQQYYFEEPSGKLDEPTHAALRRFQIRRGLAVTGEVDSATLQALEGGPAPTVAPAPALTAKTTTPAAEAAIPPALEQQDKEFLKQIEQTGEPAGAAVQGAVAKDERPRPAKQPDAAPRANPPIAARNPAAPERETDPAVTRRNDEKPSAAANRKTIALYGTHPGGFRPADSDADAPAQRAPVDRDRPAFSPRDDDALDPEPWRARSGQLTIHVDPDGRAFAIEKKSVNPTQRFQFEVPRAEVAEPRHHGFFHRLFHDHDRDERD